MGAYLRRRLFDYSMYSVCAYLKRVLMRRRRLIETLWHLKEAQTRLKTLICNFFRKHKLFVDELHVTLRSDINAMPKLTRFKLTRDLINANSSILNCFYW